MTTEYLPLAVWKFLALHDLLLLRQTARAKRREIVNGGGSVACQKFTNVLVFFFGGFFFLAIDVLPDPRLNSEPAAFFDHLA